MANRYWVGGTGSWTSSTTTNWSATSGGTGGASAPTTIDDVYLDSNSGVGTITTAGASCRSFYCTNPTTGSYSGTIVFGTSAFQTALASYGDFILSPSMTLTMTQLVYFFICQGNGFWNVDFAGKGLGATYTFLLGQAGSTVNLLSDITRNDTQTGVEFFIPCTLITNNYNVAIRADNGNAFVTFDMTNRSRLGSSVFNIQAGTVRLLNTSSAVWESSTLLINRYQAPTSFTNIVINTGSSATIGRLRIITPTVITGNIAIGACTMVAAATVTQIQTTVNFIANSTGYPIIENLSSESTAGNRRVLIASSTYGLTQTFAVNGTTDLTDVDFRDVNVIGKSSPISGTRIGNRGNTTGISFTPAKNVYSVYNGTAAVSWYDNIWSLSPEGSASLNNFPLAQDTVVVQNNSLTQIILQNNAAGNFVGSIDMSARTSALTVTHTNSYTCYGNWTNGSGISFSSSNGITFSGGNTQTITSAGKTFTCSITVDTYGGTVQLADALNSTGNLLTVTNGTFTTVGYAVTAGTLSSNNSNVRTINLGASTVTLDGIANKITCATTTNLTFNAGTSNIIIVSDSGNNWAVVDAGAGLVFYDVSINGGNSSSTDSTLSGACTFRNLTFVKSSFDAITRHTFNANITVTGTLTISTTTPSRRIGLKSSTLGTPRTITAGAFSGSDCDFQDIILAGAAAGASPTRAGDCGNNLGITFPAAKTVYWNLAGTQNWSAIGWATSSGGTPAVNNFPLAQDTAVFDNAGSAGTVVIERSWTIGTVNASLRTTGMTLSTSTLSPLVYGNWLFGTGVTSSSTTGTITFSKNGTQTITSNGVQFGCPITISNPLANVQLADALSLNSARTLTLTSGTFDAVSYNVTTGLFSNSSTSNTVKMGSGTWTLSGVNPPVTGTVWSCSTPPILIAETSTIVLSDTSTSARTFAGGGLYYNKLTIGGATGISTLTITGDNTFDELASTKTVAHTIAFGTTVQTFGKWGVTGTLGNVVTLTGTSTTNVIAGPAVTGVDYLIMGTWGISTTSPGEFYAGANSTGTATAPVFRTAAPSPRTLYWVGGTGNWSNANRWAASSGGAGGEAIPTSLDSVIFDSLSNATGYTATVNAGVDIARCKNFTMDGPASGNVTFAGSVPIAFNGNVSFAATGITYTHTGTTTFSAITTGKTVTTNGIVFGGNVTFSGVGGGWTLGSAFSCAGNTLTVTNGTFNTSTSNYAVTATIFSSSNSNVRKIQLRGSLVTLTSFATPWNMGTSTNATLNAGTSTINGSGTAVTFAGGGLTYYNVEFTSTAKTVTAITGANTFNNLSITGQTSVGLAQLSFSADQTINGTFTVSAGTASAYRISVFSNTFNTPRTLTCAAVSFTDTDFRDITIAGAASPASGTRLGDAKGNSGITFNATKTVFYRQTGSANWADTGSGSWSATSGGALDATMFPLPQDTAVFPAATYPASGSTTTINGAFFIGTIDMSLRTSNTMTLANGSNACSIFGNWINGTGITLSGTGLLFFYGQTTQQITSAGRSFTQPITINSVGGSVTLQDAFTTGTGVTTTLTSGTLNLQSYTFSTGLFNASNSTTRTLTFGSSTISLTGTGTVWDMSTSTNATINKGTGTISLTDTSTTARTFAGGGLSYPKLSIGGTTGVSTLTFSGNNTFEEIASTKTVANTISLAATTQTVGAFTATGTVGNLLTIIGSSLSSPATLIYTGAGAVPTLAYVAPTYVKAYPLISTWSADANSTAAGALGFTFPVVVNPKSSGNFMAFF